MRESKKGRSSLKKSKNWNQREENEDNWGGGEVGNKQNLCWVH